MIPISDIRRLADRIADQFRPERVVLFGSYAHGKPTEDSDVDLLVVLDHDGRSTDKAAEIRLACHGGFPLDLLVYSPARLKARLDLGDAFLRDVIDKGTALYEAHRV